MINYFLLNLGLWKIVTKTQKKIHLYMLIIDNQHI